MDAHAIFPLKLAILGISSLALCSLALLIPAPRNSDLNSLDPYFVSSNSDRDIKPPQRRSEDSHGKYAPSVVSCPSPRPTIRSSDTISANERDWLKARRNMTIGALKSFLARANISGLDTNTYIDQISNNVSAVPNVAIAISGGGYRALMNGAGAVAAFDNRTTNSTSSGQLGGLLQSATYLAGLSGGSWLVGSLYVPNLRSVQDILDMNPNASDSLWQFSNTIFEGPTSMSTISYFNTMTHQVNGKEDVGFSTSLTDYWGRGLSYQIFNASTGGPDYFISRIAYDPDFASGTSPMPIIVADERAPNQLLISTNTTIYEFTPWELGTYDKGTYGFAPLQYVGSNFSAGSIHGNQQCVEGFDNAGFVIGTSSSLFNQALLLINNTGAPEIFKSAITNVLTDVGEANNDIANWPNPFFGYRNDTNPNSQSTTLTLVDGGEDLQNIPFHPLLNPLRTVDVIFAVDGSCDTPEPGACWPNGTAMVATYQRSIHTEMGANSPFPSIPDQNTFLNEELNARPTFFGCNTSNLTTLSPLIVYLPNSPYSYFSNYSTFTMEYNNTERNSIITNGYNVATRGNGSLDSDWPACVGCAVLARSLERTGTALPNICIQCFDRYCWDGTVNSTRPGPYAPTYALKSSGAAKLNHLRPSVLVLVTVVLSLLL